jgi:Transcriptional activator of glycolytic enzymes
MEQGNPTRSREILDLIKFVKKKEVRRQGVPSQARRPLTLAEFRSVVQALKTGRGGDGPLAKYGVPAQMAFQFHLIARIDCICHFQRCNLKSHDRFPLQALKVKLNWSKNVLEERDAPWQTVLGSIDSSFCVLLNLAVWLELTSRRLSPYLFNFSEDTTIPSGGDKGKQRAMDVLRVVLRDLELDLQEGEVGTHSIRKCASTHVRGNGVSKDDKDTRGRWKATSRVSDRYDSVQLPFVDTKVAASLCIGGACTYTLSEAIPEHFVYHQVVPEIFDQYGPNVALVLGNPVLWACFTASVSHLVPLFIKDRVLGAYASAGLEEEPNPVERRLVVVTGDSENVSLTKVSREEASARQEGGGSRDSLAAIEAQLRQNQGHLEELRLQFELFRNQDRNQDRALMEKHHRITNENLKRIAMAPAHVVGRSTAAAVAVQMVNNHLGDPKAVLAATPRTLHHIWDEWTTGLNGNKPASEFTRVERGKDKHKFHRRKVLWDAIGKLVRAGLTSQVAIDRIHAVYGRNQSITCIIERIKEDKKNGVVHASLNL